LSIILIKNAEDLLLALGSLFEQSGFILLDHVIKGSNRVSRIFFCQENRKPIMDANDQFGGNQLAILACENLKKINVFSHIIGELILEGKNKELKDYDYWIRRFVIGLTLSKIKNVNDILLLFNEVDSIVAESELSSNDYLEEMMILQVKKKRIYVFIAIISSSSIIVSEILIQLLFLANKLDISFVNPKIIPSIFKKLISNKVIMKGNRLKIKNYEHNKNDMVKGFFEYLSKYTKNKDNGSNTQMHTVIRANDIYSKITDKTKLTDDKEKINKPFQRIRMIMKAMGETELYLSVLHDITKKSYRLHFSYIDNRLSHKVLSDDGQIEEANLQLLDLISKLIGNIDSLRNC